MKHFRLIFSLALVLAAVATFCADHVYAGSPGVMDMDTEPGPAYATIDGKIIKIEGSVYTVQTETTGYQNMGSGKIVQETKMYVSDQTKKLHGNKKVGDKVRAELTRGGFANSIQ